MGQQTEPEVGVYSVDLAVSLFELASKANKENNIQAAIVYFKAAQVFIGLALDDDMAGIQL